MYLLPVQHSYVNAYSTHIDISVPGVAYISLPYISRVFSMALEGFEEIGGFTTCIMLQLALVVEVVVEVVVVVADVGYIYVDVVFDLCGRQARGDVGVHDIQQAAQQGGEQYRVVCSADRSNICGLLSGDGFILKARGEVDKRHLGK